MLKADGRVTRRQNDFSRCRRRDVVSDYNGVLRNSERGITSWKVHRSDVALECITTLVSRDKDIFDGGESVPVSISIDPSLKWIKAKCRDETFTYEHYWRHLIREKKKTERKTQLSTKRTLRQPDSSQGAKCVRTDFYYFT